MNVPKLQIYFENKFQFHNTLNSVNTRCQLNLIYKHNLWNILYDDQIAC